MGDRSRSSASWSSVSGVRPDQESEQIMVWDPLVEERVAPNVTVGRDDKGNPQVVPRGGTEAVTYTRASYLADYLTYFPKSLSDWRGRYEAQGIARFPDLAARAAAVSYSTGPLTGTQPIEARRRAAAELDAVREEAATRMGINEAANLGTAGHSLTEPGSAGQVAPELADVVAGYNDVTAGLDRVGSEIFVVNDKLRTAGTFDSAYIDPVNFPGFVIIGDTKTGKNYHQAEFEIQLAGYQGGELYQGAPVNGVDQRLTFEEAFGLPVHTDVAYLVHVSITGAPKPRIIKLDLARGRRLAQLAADARDAREEIDHCGIGERLNHRELAIHRLQDELAELFGAFDRGPREGEEREALRLLCLRLHERFKTVWENSDTLRVRERLA